MKTRKTRSSLAIVTMLGMLLALLPMPAASAQVIPDLIITGVVDGPLTGGIPKAIEVLVVNDVADLSVYGLGSASNGGGTDGQEFTFPADAALAGDYLCIATESTAFESFFGFAPDYTNGTAPSINGDDAIELFMGGSVVDVFGDINTDGTGTPWEYLDGWASRVPATGPDGSTFVIANWTFSGPNALDGESTNATASTPFPIQCDGPSLPATEPVINEFSASTTGTDVEYVEIFGNPSTDYSAYTVIEIEGDSTGAGVVDEVISIGSTDTGGFYLASLPANTLENGSMTLLLVKDFTGAYGDDLDVDNDGVFDATPWGGVADAVAVTDGGSTDAVYGIPVLGPNYDGVSSFAPGGASRIPDGFDTDASADWVRNDFDLFGIPGYSGSPALGEAENTPGAANASITVPTDPVGICGDTATLISDIQGSGLASTDVGSIREIEAVVVATFQGSDQIGGYFVQEEDSDADADPLTSEGLRVFDTGNTPNVGDVVRLRGSVTEFFGLTELNNVTGFEVCGSGVATPSTVMLPLGSIDDLESYEGMAVTFPQPLYISEYFNYDRFGEVVLTSQRHLTPTAVFEPGSPEAAQAALDFSLDKITLDDGRGNQNPDPAIHPNGGVFDLTNLFRGGDTVANVTGVLDYNFGAYKIQPTQGADYTSVNPRTAAPDPVGGNLKVASFNVLNYFTTLDDGVNDICGPAGDQECRGADDAGEFTRQRDKIIAALSAMDADVVGLIEIENHPGDVPTADLVSGLNDVLGAGTYDYVATGAIGDDAIRQAFIYKPVSVSPVGAFAVLDSSVDSRFLDTKNRPALAQTFQDRTTGGVFTVAVNHLKSKGSACDDIGDPNLGDGAGNCNLTREAAAEALVDWLATDPTDSGDEDFLIIGDLNSYDKEDPIDAIVAGGYTDLIHHFVGEDAYSYVFDGQIGYLDHALANAGLMNEVTGVTVWHINADEADLIDYDTSFKQAAQDAIYAPDSYRSSDHDPVIIGLAVCDEIAPTIEVSVSPDTLWPANHKYVDVTATVVVDDDFDLDPTITLVSVESNEPDNGEDDGNTVDDIVIVDDFTFQLRAERSGIGTGRIYTITYEVTDACGNSTLGTAQVYVPLSKGSNR